METLTVPAAHVAPVAVLPPSEDQVKLQVRQLIARLFPSGLTCERRNSGRYPFPFLVRLTPVDERTGQPTAEPMVVVGKDLSERGLGFYHPQPLPYRRAIVTLEDSSRRVVSFLIDLSWCRFTRFGWYDSGGRFLQMVNRETT